MDTDNKLKDLLLGIFNSSNSLEKTIQEIAKENNMVIEPLSKNKGFEKISDAIKSGLLVMADNVVDPFDNRGNSSNRTTVKENIHLVLQDEFKIEGNNLDKSQIAADITAKVYKPLQEAILDFRKSLSTQVSAVR